MQIPKKNNYKEDKTVNVDNEAPVESPDDTRVTNSSDIEHKIDAKELKSRVSFSKLLERDGKELIPTYHAFRCMCPFHKDDRNQFYLWSNDSGGTCYGCERKGDIYAYLMEKHKMEFREALEKLQGLAKHIQREEGGAA